MSSMESSMEAVHGDLAVRIRAERRRRKMTQKDVAAAAGIGLRTYQMFEKGQTTPQGPNLRAILQAVGVDGVDTVETAEKTRSEWPGDIRVFLDMMGAFLMTMDEDERMDFIHEETRRIIRGNRPG